MSEPGLVVYYRERLEVVDPDDALSLAYEIFGSLKSVLEGRGDGEETCTGMDMFAGDGDRE